MNTPWTYTLVIKVDEQDDSLSISQVVREKLGPELPAGVVIGRIHAGEALVLAHVESDSSAYGRCFGDWLAELPFGAPYPRGSLLWYR